MFEVPMVVCVETKRGKKVRFGMEGGSSPLEVTLFGANAQEPNRYSWGDDSPASMLLAFDLLLLATQRLEIATAYALDYRQEVIEKAKCKSISIPMSKILCWIFDHIAEKLTTAADLERLFNQADPWRAANNVN